MLMNCNIYFHFKHQINIEYSNRYVLFRYYPLIIPNPFSFLLLQLIDNLVSGRGVITDKASKHNIKSNIYVPRATVMDSGNYTCISQELKTNSTVKVHVLVDGKLLSLFFANKLCQNNPKYSFSMAYQNNHTLFKDTVTFYKLLNPELFETHVYNTSYHLHYLYTIQKIIQPWSLFHLLSTLIQKNNPENIFFYIFCYYSL